MISRLSRRAVLGLPVAALVACGDGSVVTTVPASVDGPAPASSGPSAAAFSPQAPTSGPTASSGPASSGPASPAATSDVAAAAWADGQPTFGISLVRGYGVEEAVDVLTGVRAPRFDTLQQAMDWAGAVEQPTRCWGYAGVEGDWTLLWEEVGLFGWREEVARRLSRRGVVASAHQDEENGTMFVLARAGRIVRSIGTDHPSNAVGAPLPEEAGLGIEKGMVPPSTMLVLLSRVTGTPVAQPSWRDRPGIRVFGETD